MADKSLIGGEAQRRADRIEAAKQAIIEIMQRGSIVESIVREVVRREVDRDLNARKLEELAEQVIAGGWHAERRRLFFAGAEWARRQFASDPADGFYHAMELAGEAVAKGER